MNRDPHEQSNYERNLELRDDEEAFRLKQEERRLASGKRSAGFAWVINSIYSLVIFDPHLLLRLNSICQSLVHQKVWLYLNLTYSHLAPSTKLLVLSGEWVKVKGQRLTLAILYPFPLTLDPTH